MHRNTRNIIYEMNGRIADSVPSTKRPIGVTTIVTKSDPNFRTLTEEKIGDNLTAISKNEQQQ